MITVKTNQLKQAMQCVAPAINRRSPAHADAYLCAENGELSITGRSSDVVVGYSIPCDGEDFVALIPIDRVVMSISGEETKISVDKRGQVVFKCGRNTTKILGRDTGNWSRVDWPEASIEIPVSEFSACLSEGGYAFSLVKAKAMAITAIMFEAANTKMTAVTTDGKRMAISDKPLDGTDETLTALLPSDSVSHIRRVTDSGDVAQISIIENRMTIVCGPARICIATHSGSFPDYRSAVPEYSKAVKINADWITELRNAAAFTSEDSRAVEITMDGEGARLMAQSDVANGRTERFIEGRFPDFEFRVSPEFMANAIEKAGGSCMMHFGDSANKPIKLTNDSGYVAVVMPIGVDK